MCFYILVLEVVRNVSCGARSVLRSPYEGDVFSLLYCHDARPSIILSNSSGMIPPSRLARGRAGYSLSRRNGVPHR
jgi:hypothetical protein